MPAPCSAISPLVEDLGIGCPYSIASDIPSILSTSCSVPLNTNPATGTGHVQREGRGLGTPRGFWARAPGRGSVLPRVYAPPAGGGFMPAVPRSPSVKR